MELSVYSSLTLLVRTALGSEDGARIGQEGFFSNWEMTTLIPITTNGECHVGGASAVRGVAIPPSPS